MATSTGAAASLTSQLGGSTGTTTSALTSNKKALDNVDFTTYITLLTKQLQNQDPLKPMDSSQFTSEIATYAQLEQQTKSNTLLTKLSDAQNYTQQAVASSYLGKEVLADGNTVTYDGSNVVDFGYTVGKAGAVNATVDIINNSTGAIVKTTKVDTDQGLHAITWDGKAADGSVAPAGQYTVRFAANNSDGTVVPVTAQTYVKATEMVTQDGAISMKLANGNVVDFSDIKSVRTPRS